MSENAVATDSEKTRKKTRAEKRVEHKQRITRTLVACFMGILTGGLSFYLSGAPDPATGLQQNAIIGIILLLAGVVFQKHAFMLLKIDYMELTSKDWFYQGFMTFALWLISWTLLLTTTVL
jgi:multisubunit Na+/H+ antiporter MnhB subunit